MCATVDSQCLEYLGYITLISTVHTEFHILAVDIESRSRVTQYQLPMHIFSFAGIGAQQKLIMN